MPGVRKFNNLASLEVPSFDLLLEEDNGDMQGVSVFEPAEAGCISATSNTIFDHIRKKSRDFPTLMLSKSMDSSYEPLILKKMKTSSDQFDLDQGSLHADAVSPTNTAEKCRRIMSRTSEKSRSLFAGKMDSPSEKSKILIRTPDENSLQLAGKMVGPSEKSKILTRTPDENFLPLAGKMDGPSEKSKILTRTPDENSADKSKFWFSRPLADFQAMQCTKQAPATAQPLRIQDYCKDILASAKGSETGTSFLGFKSVFSFL